MEGLLNISYVPWDGVHFAFDTGVHSIEQVVSPGLEDFPSKLLSDVKLKC
jgi:hypothetical protein